MIRPQSKRLVFSLTSLIWIIFCSAPFFLYATPLTTSDKGGEMFDEGGEMLDIQKMMDPPPEVFVQFMENHLRKGNIDALGSLSTRLIQNQKSNTTALTLHCIYLASKEQTSEAKELLSSIPDPDRLLYALYATAMVQRLEKQFQESIKTCEKAITMDKTHPYPWNIKGRVYFDMGNYAEAVSNFKKAVELEPAFLPGYSNLGAAHFTLEDYAASVQAFNSALQLHPKSVQAYYGLGLAYLRMGQKKLAIDAFEKVREINPGSTMLLEELGALYIENKQYENALETGKAMQQAEMPGASEILASASLHLGNLKQAGTYLNNAPENSAGIQYLSGFHQMLQGRHAEALKQMEALLEGQPSHFGAYIARAALKLYLKHPITLETDLKTGWGESFDRVIYFSRGCVQAANGELSQAALSFNNSSGMIQGFSLDGLDGKKTARDLADKEIPHLNLGVIYYLRAFTEAAFDEFKKAVDTNSSSALSNYWTAQALLGLEKQKQALPYFKTAITTAPKFFPALYATAELSIMAGDTNAALTYYDRAREVKKDPGVLVKLGILNERLTRPDRAEFYYNDLIQHHPDLFIGYNQLAWLYARQGKNLDKANALAHQADKLQPGNASILDTMGWIYYKIKDYHTALAKLNQAKQVSPESPSILYHLGAVHHAMNQRESAKEYLEKALDLSKYFDEINDAKALLKKIN